MTKHFAFLSLFLLPGMFSYAQDCAIPAARQSLNGNNIRALITGGGSLFFDGNDAGFQVPVPDPLHTIFAQGMWLGAVDPAGNLKVAAQTYGLSDDYTDYFAGPLDEMGAANRESCRQWDRAWNVFRYQVEAHRQDFADNGAIDNPIAEIMGWPGKGNPFFSGIYGFDLPSASQGLAPFFDQDGDGSYNPMAGDYPMPPRTAVVPEQMAWTIFNDAGNIHSESQGEPLQVEVQLAAWAYQCADNPQLNNTIFTSYKVINRGFELLDSLHLGLWVDFDLGCFTEDFVGSAPALNTAFVYNQDNEDDVNCGFGVTGYGENPPVQAVTVLNKALAYMMYYNNGSIDVPFFSVDPVTSLEYYRYLTGHWRDGAPLSFGGIGYDPTGTNPPTNFAFPGDPNDPSQWSAFSEGLPFADQRVVSVVRLEALPPGALEEVDVAYSYFREEDADHLGNVTAMYAGIENLQAWYDGRFEDICGQAAICVTDCIWAGDANADGIANHCDLLALALAENAQGPTRSGPYNWSPQNGADWPESQGNGANYKHLDADGNGAAAIEDFLLTALHYNLTRPDYLAPPAVYREGPELLFDAVPSQFDFNNLSAGQSTNLGRVQLTADVPGLYALAFSLEYDTAYFDYIRALQSGFNLNAREFATGTDQPAAPGRFDYVVAATNGAVPAGLLGLLEIKVRDAFAHPLPADTSLIRFRDIKAVRSDGTEIEIGGNTVTARFQGIFVAAEEPPAPQDIRLFPNPASGRLELRFPGRQLGRLEIFDAAGRRVWRQEGLFSDAASLNLEQLQGGVYFVKLWLGKDAVVRRLLLVPRSY